LPEAFDRRLERGHLVKFSWPRHVAFLLLRALVSLEFRLTLCIE
jgi:hypothetical protein